MSEDFPSRSGKTSTGLTVLLDCLPYRSTFHLTRTGSATSSDEQHVQTEH